MAESRFAPNQWETSEQSNAVSPWLGASLESALVIMKLYANHTPYFDEGKDTWLAFF